MTQLELIAPCRVPKQGTQHYTLLLAFKRGEVLTVGEALLKYGVYALSQRVGDLKKMGWEIEAAPVEGASHYRYWMPR